MPNSLGILEAWQRAHFVPFSLEAASLRPDLQIVFPLLLLGYLAVSPTGRQPDDARPAAILSHHAGRLLLSFIPLLPVLHVRGVFLLLFLFVAQLSAKLLAETYPVLRSANLRIFSVEQLLHVGLLMYTALCWWTTPSSHQSLLFPKYAAILPAQTIEFVWIIILLFFNTRWAGAFVGKLLQNAQLNEPNPGTPNMGRTIGVLERILAMTALLFDAWGSLGLILAAKSIARFKALEASPPFAEYYLVGTLASIALAVVSTVLVKWLVGI